MHRHAIRRSLFGETNLCGAIDGTTDGGGATNLAHSDLQTKVGVDVDHNLDLGAGLDTLDSELGNGLLGLPDNLADVLLLLIRVEVGVFVVSGLLLLGLGLGLGDLDLAGTLANTDQNITTLLGGGVLGNAASGQSSVGVQERVEAGLVVGGELNTDGLAQVWGNSDHGVDRLLDILSVELLNQGSLESGTTGSQLRGVDSSSGSRGGQDSGGLREDVGGQLSNLGGVGGSTGEDNLICSVSTKYEILRRKWKIGIPHRCQEHRAQPS